MPPAVHRILRQLILSASEHPVVSRFVRRNGMRLGASRFVAGETLDECVKILRGLGARGFYANTTLLGESVRTFEEAERVQDAYVKILERIAEEDLRTNIALKLSHLGIDLGEEVAQDNLRRLLIRARELRNFIRIDMEESRRVDGTLRIYRALRQEGFDNVGAVLQAYLLRSQDDLASLLLLKPNLRIVKGAYLEPPDIALSDGRAINESYIRLAERSLLEAGHTCIATHDGRLIDHVIAFTEREDIPLERFEFQMVYGVRKELQRELVRRGYKVLVATPFGPDWYPYLMRRMAERPANVMLGLRNLLVRDRPD